MHEDLFILKVKHLSSDAEDCLVVCFFVVMVGVVPRLRQHYLSDVIVVNYVMAVGNTLRNMLFRAQQ